MNEIHLKQVLPMAFGRQTDLSSDVWQKELTFNRSKSYLIEAASGMGKSSLCSYLYGYRHDYSGTILFDQTDLRTLGTAQWVEIRRSHLSLLFQELRLFGELTAWENVLLKNRLTHHKDEKEILSLFEALGIADKCHQRADRLSFGQQQRVAFIRCLCQPFDFILLDEPVSHLDDANAATMARLLADEALRQGAGIVTTSIGKRLPLDYDVTIKL